MSWVEFQLRLIGYQREQKQEVRKLRELSWHVYTAPHRDPKKLKKTIDQFWPIDNEKQSKEVTDKQKEAFKKAWEQYEIDLKNAKEKKGKT